MRARCWAWTADSQGLTRDDGRQQADVHCVIRSPELITIFAVNSLVLCNKLMCDNNYTQEGKRGRKGENEPLFSHLPLWAWTLQHVLTLLRNVHQAHISLYGLLLNGPNQLLHNRGSSAWFDEYRMDFIGLNMIAVTYSELNFNVSAGL